MLSRSRLAMLAISLFLSGGGWAQQPVEYSAEVERLFGSALDLYTSGNYHQAGEAFGRIVTNFPSSHRITAAYIMRAKALYRAEENFEAAKTARAFLGLFPWSAYVTDAELVLGLIQCRIERYGEAVGSFLRAWEALPDTGSARLRQMVELVIDTTIDHHLSLDSTYRLLQNAARPETRAYFWSKIADKEVAKDNFIAASVALDSLLFRYPGAIPKERVDRLRFRVSGRTSVSIGALVPFSKQGPSAPQKDVGTEVAEGIQLAVEQFAQEPNKKVKASLEMRDTERDTALVIHTMQELAENRDVVAVLGPVFSAPTLAAARMANALRVPLMTPTANANGIAAIGPFVFQANPDYEARGRAMARYAVTVRNCTTLAVLAPSDTYGKYLAEGFLKGAEELGARVVATEWYKKGNPVLRTQLENIRRAGFIAAADPLVSFSGKLGTAEMMKLVDAGIPVARLDSLMNKGSTVSASWLFGPHGKTMVDSLGLNVQFDEKGLDSLDVPVTAIHAIYLPISGAEEIGMVSSQLVYYNVHAQLLGSEEWNNLGELDANKRYCSGILFESDSHIDSSNALFASFHKDFVARFKKTPGKNALYGYDAARLMLSVIAGGATTRESLARALASVHDFRGLHSRIGLGGRRVNPWVHILQYNSDIIERVGEISADQ